MAYDAGSIKIRTFREAARATPAMYLGDDRQNGVFNCFLEILNNSCDEAIMGRGDVIEVNLKDDLVTITDYGAGVPHGPNKDCEEVLIELFTKSHTSGKFDSENYSKVRGLHGVGSSAVCVCSKIFSVITCRDGYKFKLNFFDGIPETKKAKQLEAVNYTGTQIMFEPDKEIFHLKENEKAFDYERIKNELELTSYFIPNVHFILTYNNKKEEFYSKNGIKDFAKTKIINPVHKNYIYGYENFDDGVEIEVIAQWTSGKEEGYVFSNGAFNSEGGTPITGVKAAFTRTINSLEKTVFDGDTIRKGLVYIVNVKHPHPIYQNQVKNKIQNMELRGYTQTVFTNAIKDFYKRHRDEFNTIVEMLKKEMKAEAAAERARKQVLDATKEIEKSQKVNDMDIRKLSEAENLGENAILLCVEGKSAASNIRKARDPKKFGVLQLRGKCINALSNPIEDVLKNEEVLLLLKATGINIKNYKQSKLRYGKVGICVDADDDGRHIACLIIALFYVLAPDFLRENRLVWLHAPLYKVTKNGKKYYYYTDEELANGVKGEQIHFKGLGEMDDLSDNKVMFNQDTQKLETLTWDESIHGVINNLMGKDSQPKKDFVFDNIDFEKYGEI